MTLDQHIQKMRRLADELVKADKPVYLAAQSALSQFSERVFTKGEDANGGQFIYDYKTPLYVDPTKTFGNTSSLKPPRGKTGKKVFASTGQPHKTTWVESYQALRGLVGREDSFVNWVATGDLKSEIENRSSGDVQPIKVNDADYKIAVLSKENSEKLKGKSGDGGLIKKYPNVFVLSKSEKATFFKVFDIQFLKLIRTGL